MIGVCVSREMIKPILVRQRDEWGDGPWGIRDWSGSPTGMKVFFAFTARRYLLKRF